MNHNFFYDRELETLKRDQLEIRQQERLRHFLRTVLENNVFYKNKFEQIGLRDLPDFKDWEHVPFTTKSELVRDVEAHPPYGSNLTFPLDQYIRLHQTSGTTGRPLPVLDTQESWNGWKKCWGYIFRAAGVVPGDRIFLAFSFGPFIGFWPPFEMAQELGCRVLSGGGQSSLQRINFIFEHQATVLVCTPSYALHLAEVAQLHGINPASSQIRITIHAGEPGASIPATKKRIETLWGAKCYDHIGASEIGAYGFECHLQTGGVHVNEIDFLVESVNPATLKPVTPGEIGELIITSLNRCAYPVIRYRTGDLVRLSDTSPCACGRTFRRLMGGILSRADDMMTIRGVNVYPSSLEAILREFQEIVEFEGQVSKDGSMDQLLMKIEVDGSLQHSERERVRLRLQEAMRMRLGLRIDVELAAHGSLPRYELKARRYKRQAPQ
ncbi:MAG: phenylacetate--CoA ligase family protein [Acidobacteria bacterium]|nr:phenylacetate--CoA ligase family protein [Acidobacteriota bacterium]